MDASGRYSAFFLSQAAISIAGQSLRICGEVFNEKYPAESHCAAALIERFAGGLRITKGGAFASASR
jgi:hypothetical protein